MEKYRKFLILSLKIGIGSCAALHLAEYLNLEYAAEERKVDAALFGHTHRVFYDKHNRIAYMNPGSIGQPPYGIPPSYGILQVDGSSNTIATDVIYLEENN